MLSRFPTRLGWDSDACEAVVFYEDLGFLREAILEASAEPGINVTRDIYGGCSDKVVPIDSSKGHIVTRCRGWRSLP